MDVWNENPKPFIWKATVADIIQKIDRARAKADLLAGIRQRTVEAD